jgi:hypothetical protein
MRRATRLAQLVRLDRSHAACGSHRPDRFPSRADKLDLARIVPSFPAQQVHQPGIETAGLDAQAATDGPHRELVAMLGHKRVSHFAFLAKYAVALFKMSRSSVTRASSAVRRRISAAWSTPAGADGFENFRFQA